MVVKYPRPDLGFTQFPIRCMSEVVPSGVKRPGIEADHSPPSSVEVENEWSYAPASPLCFVWSGQAQIFLYFMGGDSVRVAPVHTQQKMEHILAPAGIWFQPFAAVHEPIPSTLPGYCIY